MEKFVFVILTNFVILSVHKNCALGQIRTNGNGEFTSKNISLDSTPEILVESAPDNITNTDNLSNNLGDEEMTFLNFTRRIDPADYPKEVLFKYYKNGVLTYIGNGINTESLVQTGCLPSDNFAFIIHGWLQNCDSEWIPLLIGKLTNYRGGCIVCIDYGKFTKESYVRLVRTYESLTNIMSDKLKYLQQQGFDPEKGYMFGFSFGGQLACGIGKKFGTRLLKEIDTCDMAGPGFDYKGNGINHRDAAQNVQCIHTTRDKGTRHYNCHQNWRMGNCGVSQLAAKKPPIGSHGLCPYFYVSAFEHDFFAVKAPERCTTRKPAEFWPQNFKMGYMEPRKNYVFGELFAQTSEKYPYNVIPGSVQPVIVQGRKNRPVINSIIKARKFLRRRFTRRNSK